ncbi:hypothetical protein SDC9_112336 [bioreactor metagenome]|uniref:Uncharacterized protein n=1 Tax=bioreactor metagenome TaxID=1076179 RepID=A0A645BIZ5_9ZZZZ
MMSPIDNLFSWRKDRFILRKAGVKIGHKSVDLGQRFVHLKYGFFVF